MSNLSQTCTVCTVTKDYQASNGDPLSVQADEPFLVSKKMDFWNGNPDWVWIWCTDQRGKSGWVPKNRIHIDESIATTTSAYSALELTVVAGDVLEGVEEESGWLWCVNQHQEYGWGATRKRRMLILISEIFFFATFVSRLLSHLIITKFS